ncbi:MAG: DUF3288 family protein [Xenococcaceae cyanobacterium]
MSNLDQTHPQAKSDRLIVDRLLEAEPSEINLVELARLRIRYHNFPGARDIQQDLDLILQKWQLEEDRLFAKTRQIHSQGNIYRRQIDGQDKQDWS